MIASISAEGGYCIVILRDIYVRPKCPLVTYRAELCLTRAEKVKRRHLKVVERTRARARLKADMVTTIVSKQDHTFHETDLVAVLRFCSSIPDTAAISRLTEAGFSRIDSELYQAILRGT